MSSRRQKSRIAPLDAASAAGAVPRALPRGPQSLARNIVLLSQRGRLTEAMARTIAAKGYQATTIGDITREAGVSRNAFYELFKDKEDCYLVCFEEQARVHYEHVLGEGRRVRPLPGRVCAWTRAFLEALVHEPDYAKAYFLESLSAGPRALAQREAHSRRYVELSMGWLRQVRPHVPQFPKDPEVLLELVHGGRSELIAQYIRSGRTHRLLELLQPLAHVHFSVLGLGDLARRCQQASAEELEALDF